MTRQANYYRFYFGEEFCVSRRNYSLNSGLFFRSLVIPDLLLRNSGNFEATQIHLPHQKNGNGPRDTLTMRSEGKLKTTEERYKAGNSYVWFWACRRAGRILRTCRRRYCAPPPQDSRYTSRRAILFQRQRSAQISAEFSRPNGNFKGKIYQEKRKRYWRYKSYIDSTYSN